MPKLTYPEAVKAAKLLKSKDNFLTFSFDGTIVVPYKDGVQLLNALANAEKLPSSWSSEQIRALTQSDLSTHTLSAKEYEQHKIAALMGVSVSDVRRAEEAALAAEDTSQTTTTP